MQKLRGAVIYCDRNLLEAMLCIILKKIMKLQKGKSRWNVEKAKFIGQILHGNFLLMRIIEGKI
jgi:hypothetical protein